jgi:hypothetical protein
VAGLERIAKRKLSKVLYRPERLDGRLAETGLIVTPKAPGSKSSIQPGYAGNRSRELGQPEL